MFFVHCGCPFPYCFHTLHRPISSHPILCCALLCSAIFPSNFVRPLFKKSIVPSDFPFLKLFQRYCGFCDLLAAGQHPSSGLVFGHHSPSMAAAGSLAWFGHLVSAPLLSYFCVFMYTYKELFICLHNCKSDQRQRSKIYT